jgi:hypothetical protein
VADLLGQPPTRLYHHVAALERAGLLVLTEKRQNRGAVEKWYVGVGRELHGTPAPARNAAAGRSARRAVAATVLEQAKQEVMSIPAGAKEAALLTRLVVAAPPAKIPVIRRRLFEAVQALRTELSVGEGATPAPADDCERWALTLAFAPVNAPRRSKSQRYRSR